MRAGNHDPTNTQRLEPPSTTVCDTVETWCLCGPRADKSPPPPGQTQSAATAGRRDPVPTGTWSWDYRRFKPMAAGSLATRRCKAKATRRCQTRTTASRPYLGHQLDKEARKAFDLAKEHEAWLDAVHKDGYERVRRHLDALAEEVKADPSHPHAGLSLTHGTMGGRRKLFPGQRPALAATSRPCFQAWTRWPAGTST